MRELDSVGSLSSSSEKLVGVRPPPAVNEKSCGSSGWASLITTSVACLSLVNVQVTSSPAETSIFVIGDPSEHVALAWVQPDGTVSATE